MGDESTVLGGKPTDKVYDETAWSQLPSYGKFQQEHQLKMHIYDILKRDLQEGESVLDVGCGAGRLAFIVAGRYVGLDITPCYLQLARDKFPMHEWILGDCRSLPFPDESFDRVWSSNLLIHLPWDDIKVALKEMARVAKKAIYLTSCFGIFSQVEVRLGENGIPFIYNTIPFKDLRLPGWSLEKIDKGNFFVVLRKGLALQDLREFGVGLFGIGLEAKY